MRDAIFFFFKNDFDICYKRVVAITLSFSSTMPKTLLIVLVFFCSSFGKWKIIVSY